MSQEPPQFPIFMPPGWQGKLPPCLIQVTAQGEMFHQGAPLIHPGILELIFESVRLEDGVYVLRLGNQACQLEVEDTFFVVARAQEQDQGLLLTLNDGGKEMLDPASLWVGNNDVIYCRVKGGRFPARFLRAAYYQLVQLVEEGPAGFALRLGGRLYPLGGLDGS